MTSFKTKVVVQKAIGKKTISTTTNLVTQKPFIGYVGWHGTGNLGDEAVYEAARLLFPEIKPFTVNRHIARAETFLKRKVPLEAFYLGGGTLINLSSEWLEVANYAYQNKVPSFCIGTGVNPSYYLKEQSEVDQMKRWAEILKAFTYIGVRGPQSQASLKEVGVNSEVVGDSAFILAPDDYKKFGQRKVVGLNVSYGTGNEMWGNAQQFVEAIVIFVNSMIREGFEIRLLPIWQDDLAISKQVEKMVNNSSCKTVIAYRDTSAYLQEVAKCDIFIGEKLHATIFSTMLRVPSIMLAYRPKCIDYMESINMQHYTVRTDSTNSNKLQELCAELMHNHQSISEELDQYVRHYKQLQLKRAHEVRSKLLKA